MMKIVPDPPRVPHSLEDKLTMASGYALCAEAVAQHATLMQPSSPIALMLMTTLHELEGLRSLLESALAQVQMRPDPSTRH